MREYRASVFPEVIAFMPYQGASPQQGLTACMMLTPGTSHLLCFIELHDAALPHGSLDRSYLYIK